MSLIFPVYLCFQRSVNTTFETTDTEGKRDSSALEDAVYLNQVSRRLFSDHHIYLTGWKETDSLAILYLM